MAKKRVDKRAFDSNFVAQNFPIDPNAHRNAVKKNKIHKKGTSTNNPHEKDAFLKRTGPQLPGV